VTFTRRELREATGLGDTQLKVHLGRLADAELLGVSRSRSGQHVYGLAEGHEQGVGAATVANDRLAARRGARSDHEAFPLSLLLSGMSLEVRDAAE
jgi:hypothetical protein